MKDENNIDLDEAKKVELAKEWLTRPIGRPQKAIAQQVKELSNKGIVLRETAERKVVKQQTKAERKEKRKALEKARTLQKSIDTMKKREEFLRTFIESDGNLTETGLKFFNITDRSSASIRAGQYLKANQSTMRVFLEKKGYTLGWMLELLAKKAVEGRSPDFLDRLFRLSGIELQPPKNAFPTVININQAQKKLASDYGFDEGEIIDDNTEDTA